MPHRSRLAAAVTLALIGAGATGVAHAAGTTDTTTLYVNNTVSTCSDTGTGTAQTPFCDIQNAFDAVAASDTVEIVAGTYTQPATLTTSGTDAAPINVWFGAPGAEFDSSTTPALDAEHVSTPMLTFQGASHVDVHNAYLHGSDQLWIVELQNASDLTFDGGLIDNDSASAVGILGSSSDVTIQNATLDSVSAAVLAATGVSGTVISGNRIDTGYSRTGGVGVAVQGATGTVVVGNTITACNNDIEVTGNASGTVVENNLVYADPNEAQSCASFTQPIGLAVTSDSASGTTEKYDSFLFSYEGGRPVVWGSTIYSTAAAYQQATGQGANDVIRTGDAAKTVIPADYVDNADANAPDELSTDFDGNARVDDPFVANTGTGVGFYDRGTTEYRDEFSATFGGVTNASTALQVSGAYTFGAGWAPCANETATIDWGDGQSTTVSACDGLSGEASHTFAKPSESDIQFSATDGTVSVSHSYPFATTGTDYTAHGPTRVLDTRHGVGAPQSTVAQGSYVRLKIAGTGSIPADATAVAVNLTVTDTTGNGFVAAEPAGQGAPRTSNLNYLRGRTVANAAVVALQDGGIDIYNAGSGSDSADLIADVTGYFSPVPAAGYAPVALDRILDTRKGVGAPRATVAGNTGLPLAVDGVDGIPATGVDAVALHVTVTDTAGNGWIAAEPDGAGIPTTSSLNYLQGQTVSNTVIVPVAPDGKVELYNGGGTSAADLIADVAGYFSASATDVYVPLATPSRVVDTRATKSPLGSNASAHYVTYPTAVPITAMVANLTVTDETANGFVTAYPDGVAVPSVSNLNYLMGQNVAGLSLIDTNSAEQAATNVHNTSLGTTDLIIDTFGYFTGE